MKTINLTQGKVALVDDDAPSWVFEVNWCASRAGGTYYAARSIRREDGKRTMQYIHRVLLDAKLGEQIDHIDGNGLNNQLSNLRIFSNAQNLRAFNLHRTNNKSGFRGVSWFKRDKKWEAKIRHDGVKLHIGYFNSPEEAAKARDEKARSLGWPEEGMNFSKIKPLRGET
jgi:hypothetical protein